MKTNIFSKNTFYNATLYVPSGTVEKYKEKQGWNMFSYIKEGTPSGIEKAGTETFNIIEDSGILKIHGINNGMRVRVYNINGTLIGSTISHNGIAIVDANNRIDSVIIVSVGGKSYKIMIK